MKRTVLFTLLTVVGLLGVAQIAAAGRMTAPGRDHANFSPRQTIRWRNQYFVGGQRAEVAVCSDRTVLLQVFDQYGRLVVSNRGGYRAGRFECTVSWRPARTAPFTITITNLDYDDYANIGMATN